MNPTLRLWTPEEDQRLRELRAAGVIYPEIARQLDRTLHATRVRAQRLGAVVLPTTPGLGRSPLGNKRYWTRERTIAGLKDFARRNKELPRSDHVYNVLKKGHMEWPPASRVLEFFGNMADAWEAVGRKTDRSWVPWTKEEDDFLLENAGEITLKRIAKRLNRSWSACKRRLYDLEAGRARDCSGHLSAAQVAAEYNTPITRVLKLIYSGKLRAKKVAGGHYWRVDIEDCEAIRDVLTKPKRPYVTRPSGTGDYMKRYGLRRLVGADGKVHVVAAIPEEKTVRFKPVQWRDAS